jgi:TonB family protein
LDQMIASRTKDVQNESPQPFVGPPPEFPRDLRKTRPHGQAIVRVHINRHGAILDPQVESATDPEFGASALAAIRLWRFLPYIRNGIAQEATLEIPFDFAARD